MIAYRGRYDDDAEDSTTSNFNGVELSARTMPADNARHGGDWCEAFPLSRHVMALSIGDVLGHGEGCLETMAGLRQAVRDGARSGLGPSRVLAGASDFLRTSEPGMHATSILAYLDTRAKTMTFANAGHPPPVLGNANAVHFLEYPRKDAPLGVVCDSLPAEHLLEIPADSLLVLYTDGVTERERDVVKGEAQLCDATLFAHRVRGMPGAQVIERQMFLQGSNPDDAAILTARMPLVALAVPTGIRRRRGTYGP